MKMCQRFAKCKFVREMIQIHLLHKRKCALGVQGTSAKTGSRQQRSQEAKLILVLLFFFASFILTGNISIVPGGPGKPSAPGRPGRPGGPCQKEK